MRSLGIVAGGERLGEPVHPRREVAHGAEHAAHRRQCTVGIERLVDEGAIPVHVSPREPRIGNLIGLVDRGIHPERGEQPVADQVAILLAAHVREHPAQDPVAEVRVLERGPRRPREREPAAQQLGERIQRESLQTVAPRIVGGQAARHREQVPHGDQRRVGGRAPEPGELGHVGPDGFVEEQRALVTEEQHRRGREALGHRRDAEDAVGIGDAVLTLVERAEAARMDEVAGDDDPVGHPGDRAVGEQALERLVDGPQALVPTHGRGLSHGEQERSFALRLQLLERCSLRYAFSFLSALSFMISRTQWWPGMPVTPPPAWVALEA